MAVIAVGRYEFLPSVTPAIPPLAIATANSIRAHARAKRAAVPQGFALLFY